MGPFWYIIMGIRINKFLASAHVASRRQADVLVEEGRVTINGVKAESGSKVEENDLICVDGKQVELPLAKTVLAFYKPVGVTCTEKDEHADLIIEDVLNYPVRLTYAGRLDKDSEGLLIMTDDGDLINAMMRGANGHEKEYIVKIQNDVTKEFLKKMSQGVYLEELEQTTRNCKTCLSGTKSFRIILTQGLNRQIRRMCEALGERVVSLKRVRVLNVELKDLKPGEYREIKGEELETLYKMVGM